jgi:hypothetical protein
MLATSWPPLDTISAPLVCEAAEVHAHCGVGSHKKKVDELRVVRVSDTAETGHRAGEGGRIVRGVRDLKPAAAGGQENHVGGAAGFDFDQPVTDADGAAADHAGDVDEA